MAGSVALDIAGELLAVPSHLVSALAAWTVVSAGSVALDIAGELQASGPAGPAKVADALDDADVSGGTTSLTVGSSCV